MSKIRILLLEDNRLLREGITAMINGQADMKVVAASGGNSDAVLRVRRVKPRIVLMDMGLRNRNGARLVNSLSKELPEIRIVGMGLIPTQLDIVEFVQAGASGFIMKDASIKDFLATIRSVAIGGRIIPPPLTGSLFSHIADYAMKKGKRQLTKAVIMTKREREIIALIGDALSNKEIAQRLNIATYTVKSHVHNILEKLALHSRLQIAKHTRDEEAF